MIPPLGATIGIVGDGQLGRMLVLAARRLGYSTAVLGSDPAGSAGQVADAFLRAAPDDRDAVRALAQRCDVVTVETEHVPATALESIERLTCVRPGAPVLATLQDRLVQRRFLERLGLPQPAFATVDGGAVPVAESPPSFPAVLKTRTAGYDGRGQVRVATAADLGTAHAAIGGVPAILEPVIPFVQEISVLLARTESGATVCFPLVQNDHEAGILRRSIVPAPVAPRTAADAVEIATAIAHGLRYVGVLAVELFVLADGTLLVNEVAPRVHNSGHWSQEACATSQFEQHIRAICGLPLGSTDLRRPAVLVNLLGEDLQDPRGLLAAVAQSTDAHLHLYGKSPPRPGRKMGHFVVLGDSIEDALLRVAGIERSGARRSTQ